MEFIEIAKTFETQGQDLDWTVYRIGYLTDAEERNIKAGFVGEKGSALKVSRIAIAKHSTVAAARKKPPT
jgi:hypothetical protein